MRVLVFGAGALGSVIGGLLSEAGEEVTLLGREEHMRAVSADGLRISGIWGEHRATPAGVSEVGDLAGPFDLIILATKSYDTPRALEAMSPLVGPETCVMTVQNGYGNAEAIAERFGHERTLGARVIFGARIVTPGHAEVTVYAEEVMIGDLAGGEPDERIARIVESLNRAGIPSKATRHTTQFIWGKLLYNAALNPLGALLGVTYGELAANPLARRIMDRIVAEAFDVARANAVKLFWDAPEAFLDRFYGKLVPPTAAHRSSMLQDIEKGKPTEIDALNGAIVRLGARTQTPTPVNETITLLVKAKEDASRPA